MIGGENIDIFAANLIYNLYDMNKIQIILSALAIAVSVPSAYSATKHADPADIDPASFTDWQFADSVMFTDDMLNTLYSGATLRYKLAMESSASAPGIYRLVNPYGEKEYPYYGILTGITHLEGDHYMYIDATDPEAVFIRPSEIGIQVDNLGMPLTAVSYAYAMWKYNERATATFDDWINWGYGGTFADGNFSFPKVQSLLLLTDLQSIRGFQVNKNGGTTIEMSSAKDYTIGLNLSSFCWTPSLRCDVSKGRDVKHVKYYTLPVDAENSGVPADAVEMDITSGSFNIPQPAGAENGKYMLYVVTYGEDLTQPKLSASSRLYLQIEEPAEDWESEGMAQFTDGILTPHWGGLPPTYLVEIQHHRDNPSLFRLVNPWGSTYPYYYSGILTHSDHPHYLYVDASEPEAVVIGESVHSYAMHEEYGDMAVTSYAQMLLDRGETMEKIKNDGNGGVYDVATGTITFGPRKLYVSEVNFNEGKWYLTDNGGNTKIVMPAFVVGLDDVEVENEIAPVYYNMQGMRISTPAPGQPVIVKQGTKVTKQIF